MYVSASPAASRFAQMKHSTRHTDPLFSLLSNHPHLHPLTLRTTTRHYLANPPSPPDDTDGSSISLGSSPSLASASASTNASRKGMNNAASSSRAAAALAFARTATDADYTETEKQEADGEEVGEAGAYNDEDKELAVPHTCTSPILVRPKSSFDLILSKKPETLQRTSSGNIWQKREVVTQERTVHYTTIDDDGVLQELIEKETSQTEVLHMESRDTGVFAHRETTLYDQTETFNSQVVCEAHGVEEYVHMRSEDDEVSLT